LPVSSATGLPELQVAAGVLLDGEGRALIAQRAAGSHQGGAWEFPGGKITAGETSLEGLVRELHEELGVQVLYARHLVRFSHQYPDRTVHLHVWQVLRWEGEPEGLEGQPLRWVAVEELLNEGLLAADEQIVTALQNPAVVNKLAWRAFADAVSGLS
jgi:8-oxo-dGTP diphosphatase